MRLAGPHRSSSSSSPDGRQGYKQAAGDPELEKRDVKICKKISESADAVLTRVGSLCSSSPHGRQEYKQTVGGPEARIARH